jgi:hypothetical protein
LPRRYGESSDAHVARRSLLSTILFLTTLAFVGYGVGNEQGGHDARGQDADGPSRRVLASELEPQPNTTGKLSSTPRERGVAIRRDRTSTSAQCQLFIELISDVVQDRTILCPQGDFKVRTTNWILFLRYSGCYKLYRRTGCDEPRCHIVSGTDPKLRCTEFAFLPACERTARGWAVPSCRHHLGT